MKLCVKCKETKPKSEFNKHKKNKDGLQGWCRSCSNKASAGWWEENPSSDLLRRYGITLEEKQDMMASQGGGCAICKEPFNSKKHTHVDHCHTTNKIRGILCHACNTSLGGFKDSPKLLQRAIHYIEYHVKQNTTTQLSEGSYIQGAVGAELGSISTPWTWEDDDDPHHHCGTIRGEDVNHRAQEGSGDGVGRGGKEVVSPQAPQSVQDNGVTDPAIAELFRECGYIPHQP